MVELLQRGQVYLGQSIAELGQKICGVCYGRNTGLDTHQSTKNRCVYSENMNSSRWLWREEEELTVRIARRRSSTEKRRRWARGAAPMVLLWYAVRPWRGNLEWRGCGGVDGAG